MQISHVQYILAGVPMNSEDTHWRKPCRKSPNNNLAKNRNSKNIYSLPTRLSWSAVLGPVHTELKSESDFAWRMMAFETKFYILIVDLMQALTLRAQWLKKIREKNPKSNRWITNYKIIKTKQIDWLIALGKKTKFPKFFFSNVREIIEIVAKWLRYPFHKLFCAAGVKFPLCSW